MPNVFTTKEVQPMGGNAPTNNSSNPIQPISQNSGQTTMSNNNVQTPESPNSSNTTNTDPNRVKVTLADTKIPIIVLFGPPSCGKTMTLIRMARWLKEQNYVIKPVKGFRPSDDENYKKQCDDFDEKIVKTTASGGTALMEFMLIDVLKGGNKICQMLEAPGELYFDPRNPKAPFPPYLEEIISKNNQKIWTIFIEPDWKEDEIRRSYVDRIKELTKKTRGKDRFIFLYNKIDATSFVIRTGQVNEKSAIEDVENNYHGIFEPFKVNIPIISLFIDYSCKFIPFQTGVYNEQTNGQSKMYTQGPDEYPHNLWNAIMKDIKG